MGVVKRYFLTKLQREAVSKPGRANSKQEGCMKFKLVEDGSAILADEKGLPVVLQDDGTELGIDAIGLYTKVPELQAEAKKHRLNHKSVKEELEATLAKLSVFSVIEDPEAAIRAIETVKNLKDGDLIKAGEAENMKRQMVATFEQDKLKIQNKLDKEIKDLRDANAHLTTNLNQTVISSHFSRSKFCSESLALPVDIVENYFGKHFRTEVINGKPAVIGYLGDDKIYSTSNPGTTADFDEALSKIVDRYHDKEAILKVKQGTTTTRHNTQTHTQGEKPLSSAEKINAGLKKRYNM